MLFLCAQKITAIAYDESTQQVCRRIARLSKAVQQEQRPVLLGCRGCGTTSLCFLACADIHRLGGRHSPDVEHSHRSGQYTALHGHGAAGTQIVITHTAHTAYKTHYLAARKHHGSYPQRV